MARALRFGFCLLLVACGESHDGDAGSGDAGALDSGSEIDAGADAGTGDAGNDGGAVADAGSDAAVPSDAGAVTHYGVVSVGDDNEAGFTGQIRGAFVSEAELGLLGSARAPITGAPDCYDLIPPPPAVPTYLDAGTIVFDGLVLASHSEAPSSEGDYRFDYAGLLSTPDSSIALSVPGATVIDPMMASIGTPDPAVVSGWSLGSTGVFTTWTSGNGDFVLLRFQTSEGPRECQVPDTGSYLVPAPALNPSDRPSDGFFTFERVIETATRSASGTQELRFRAFARRRMPML